VEARLKMILMMIIMGHEYIWGTVYTKGSVEGRRREGKDANG
jgi:hypothetical protein